MPPAELPPPPRNARRTPAEREAHKERVRAYRQRLAATPIAHNLDCASAPVTDPATPRTAQSLPTPSLTPQLV